MRKTALSLALLAFVLLLGTLRSEALMPIPMLEVTGIFKGLDTTENPPLILLEVDGKKASGPLDVFCVFMDEKQRLITRDEFLKLYLNRVITVEIAEDSGVVKTCRVGS